MDFTGETGKPFPRLSPYGAVFGYSRQRSMNNSFNVSNLGEGNGLFVEPHAIVVLFPGEAIVAAFAFETRIAGSLSSLDASEERSESKIDAHGDILQEVRMNRREFRVRFLPAREDFLLLKAPHLFTFGFIGEGTPVQKRVIDAATDFQGGFQRRLLRASR